MVAQFENPLRSVQLFAGNYSATGIQVGGGCLRTLIVIAAINQLNPFGPRANGPCVRGIKGKRGPRYNLSVAFVVFVVFVVSFSPPMLD